MDQEANFEITVKRLHDEGFRSYMDLPGYELDNLLSIYINEDDTYVLAMPEIFNKIRAYIQFNKFHHALELAHEIKSQLQEYNRPLIEEEFNNIVSDLETSKNEELGLKPFRDMTNGEIRWLKL